MALVSLSTILSRSSFSWDSLLHLSLSILFWLRYCSTQGQQVVQVRSMGQCRLSWCLMVVYWETVLTLLMFIIMMVSSNKKYWVGSANTKKILSIVCINSILHGLRQLVHRLVQLLPQPQVRDSDVSTKSQDLLP